MRARIAASLAVLALAACAPEPTQIVLVVDTDLEAGDPLTRIEIEIASTRTAPTRFDLDLDAPTTPALPLTVSLYPRDPGETEVQVTVRALDVGGTVIASREVRTGFVSGSSRMLRVLLAARCVGVRCRSGETCDETGCRGIAIASEDLPRWPGSPPVLDGPACEPTAEACNGGDDDCDGMADEGIELDRDAENCGRCGHACEGGGGCSAGFCATERPVEVALGGAHACVRREGGGVACWGWNLAGQAGGALPDVRIAPADVIEIGGAEGIAAGASFTCVRSAAGASCFGNGSHGELGDGMLADASAPVTVSGLATVAAISAGVAHACAIDGAGAVWCWGDNGAGQLGDGTTTTAPAPVMVGGVSGATAVAAGNRSSCAIVGAGSVVCWGANNQGQLGDGTTMASPIPVAVMGIANAVAIGVGRRHACALRMDGSVACWGANESGQLGDGGTTGSPTPVTVMGLSGATALSVAIGGTHACAVREGGAATCWGSNVAGQLGDGTTMTRASPVTPMLTDIAAIATGGHADDGGGFTCAITTTGATHCWGQHTLSRLGTGDVEPQPTPTPVIGLP